MKEKEFEEVIKKLSEKDFIDLGRYLEEIVCNSQSPAPQLASLAAT